MRRPSPSIPGPPTILAPGAVHSSVDTPPCVFHRLSPALCRETFEVMNHAFPEGFEHPWLSIQKTKGPSDLYVQNNVWAPGGTTGWHTHPGHSLIIVTAG